MFFNVTYCCCSHSVRWLLRFISLPPRRRPQRRRRGRQPPRVPHLRAGGRPDGAQDLQAAQEQGRDHGHDGAGSRVDAQRKGPFTL